MNNIKFYKYLAIILIAGILLALVVLFLISKPSQNSNQNPTPPPDRPLPNRDYSVSTQEDITNRDKGTKIAQLIQKLPYQGQYFKLEYSFSLNKFILTLNKGQENQGNSEFEIFLKDNKILSKDWLNNLQINVK